MPWVLYAAAPPVKHLPGENLEQTHNSRPPNAGVIEYQLSNGGKRIAIAWTLLFGPHIAVTLCAGCSGRAGHSIISSHIVVAGGGGCGGGGGDGTGGGGRWCCFSANVSVALSVQPAVSRRCIGSSWHCSNQSYDMHTL